MKRRTRAQSSARQRSSPRKIKQRKKLPKIILEKGGCNSSSQKAYDKLKLHLLSLKDVPVRYGNKNFLKDFRSISDFTLTGFIIALMKARGGTMAVKDILPEVIQVLDILRKPDGCKYHGEGLSSINGCLIVNKVFEKVLKKGVFTNQWRLVDKNIAEFEKKTSAKILENYQKRKIKYEQQKLKGYGRQQLQKIKKIEQNNVDQGIPATNGVGNYKLSARKREQKELKMLKKYSIAFKVLSNALEFEKQINKNAKTNIFLNNPLKSLNGNENSKEILKKLNNSERLLGMMDCYQFFKPLLSGTFTDGQNLSQKRKMMRCDNYTPNMLKKVETIELEVRNLFKGINNNK